MKKIPALIFMLFIFISCEKRIPIDVEKQDPKVVVSALYDNTKRLQVNLSRSAMIDNTSGTLPIEDASVSLFENGAFKTILSDVGNGLYTYADTLQPENTYKLDISTDIGDVTATNTMPEAVPVIAVDSIVETQIVNDAWGSAMDALMFYFTFQDMSDDQYYVIKLVLEGEEPSLGSEAVGLMYYYEYNYRTSSSGFDETNSVELYNYLRFSDGLFNGELKTYKFGVQTDIYMIQEYLEMGYVYKLRFYSLSADYYTYLQTLEAYWNSEGDFFAESINLFSNVEGGLGIFAGATMYEFKVDMSNIISRN